MDMDATELAAPNGGSNNLHQAESDAAGEQPNGVGNGVKAVLEALLFVSGEALSVERLMSTFDGISRSEMMEALRALQADYGREDRGLQLVEIAGGYQMTTRAEYAPWIKRLEKAKAGAKLS